MRPVLLLASRPPRNPGTAAVLAAVGPDFAGTAFSAFRHQHAVLQGGVLTVTYAAGSTSPSATGPSGGAQLAVPLASGPAATATLSYAVRFPIGFDFVRGGKLPGLYGGRGPFSGGSRSSRGWSTRLMWRAGGAGEVYAYLAGTTGWGDSIGRGAFTWPADGRFHAVVLTVAVNAAGTSDGVVTLDLDGGRVVTATGLRISDGGVPVGGVFFSTFFGGHDRSWAPATEQHLDFAGFRGSAGVAIGGLTVADLARTIPASRQPSHGEVGLPMSNPVSDEDALIARVPGVLSDEVDGRTVLVGPTGTHLIELNAVGSVVWDALAGPRDVDGLVSSVRDRLAVAAQVPEERIRQDVLAFLTELRSLGVVSS